MPPEAADGFVRYAVWICRECSGRDIAFAVDAPDDDLFFVFLTGLGFSQRIQIEGVEVNYSSHYPDGPLYVIRQTQAGAVPEGQVSFVPGGDFPREAGRRSKPDSGSKTERYAYLWRLFSKKNEKFFYKYIA